LGSDLILVGIFAHWCGIYNKGVMFISRKAEFSASHACRLPNLSDEQNREIYGAAANPRGHGHNYIFERVVPTPENIAIEIWRRLEPSFRNGRARLANVRLWETDDLYVDYAGGAS
jgi:6-pyruvoyltetrahydropterin/6-carboxytetrahydropterin synthase